MATSQKVMQEVLESTRLSDSLTYLLRVSSGNVPLEHWQSEIISVIESFLVELREIVNQQPIALSSVMISYALDKSNLVNIEDIAKLLRYSFSQVGFPVTLCPLSDVSTLQSQLKQHTYTILLCTPQYAKRVEEDRSIRQALDTFGRTKKNALQPLLCEGGFEDTALKIVDSHYLIRSYQAVLKKEPLTSFPYFVDIVFNIAGSQGLGILPDILDLKEAYNNKVELAYRTAFDQLQLCQQQMTINYRLTTSLVESAENHSMKPYLEPATFPVIKKVPGFQSIIQELFNTSAKVSLLFCSTKADTELTSLALTQALIMQSRRVLSIECADYPGKTAGDCVRLSLRRMKLKTADMELMKRESLLILLKGYENIGAYDNLWVKNKLSTWANVKLLVTCRTDFFKFRGYLNCFLSDVSNRQVDDLLVYKVPSFASNAAKQASLSLAHVPQTLNVTETASLNPKRSAEQIELTAFLKKLNELWVKEGYLSFSLQQNPQIFISYAWEGEKTALARQQGHLSRISQDLATLGFSAWLDIERLSGDIDEQMAGNIANSQGVLVIATPRYAERSEQNTNVKKEFDAILQKSQKDPDFKVFSLRFLPGLIRSALENYPRQCDFTNIDEDYVFRMTDPNIGLIPQMLLDSPTKKVLYENLYANFQEQLQLLAAKHLVVNQGQEDIQAHDMDNRLEGYIEPYGLYSEVSSLNKRFDLSKNFQAFLDNPNIRTAVVLGQAGSGKSLFALSSFKTFLQEWHQYRGGNGILPTWLPIYVQLRNHAKDPENCIENALLQFLSPQDIQALKQGLNHNQRMLFILDGYDELGSGIRPNLSESLRDWPLAKLLVTGRPEHFDKDHQPLETLSLFSSEGRIISNSCQVVYVSPFSADEIKRYIDFYAFSLQQDTNKAIYENAYQILQNLPGIITLLDNPFLLTLVLQSLPQLLKNWQGIDRAITRTDIYQAFTETWFLQETQGLDLNPKDCEAFSQELAFQFFQAKTISVSNILEKKDLWAFFSNNTTQAAQAVSPLHFNNGEYSFVHKSLYEYFTAVRLWKAVFESNSLIFWQARLLTEEQPVIDFLSELYRTSLSKDKEARLMSLIESSRNPDFSAIASSNAITVLNAAKVVLSGRNLKGIRIPGANLMGAILDNTNLEDANLSNVALSGAWLHGTNFKNALLADLSLGEYPSLLLKDSIESCCYSPDGKMLAVTARDNINLYDSKTRTLLMTLEGHANPVYSVCFSPDGKMLVSKSRDNTVKLWGVEDGKLQKTLEGDYRVDFSPDSKVLALLADGKVKLWGVENGELQKTLEVHTDTYDVRFSPDGRVLASVDSDGIMRLWSIESGEMQNQKELKSYTESVANVYFSPDRKLLAGSDGKTIKLWNVESGELQKTLEGHTDEVTSIHFNADGKWLVSGGHDKTVRLWNVESGELQKTLEGHTGQISSVQFSPDGKMLMSACGSYDNTVRLWDVEETKLQKTLPGRTFGPVESVHFSPDGQWLASGGYDNTVKLWNVESGELQTTLMGHTDEVTSIHFSPDGKWLASSGSYRDNTVKLWSVESGKLQKTLKGHSGGVRKVHFSPDSKLLASGGKDWNVKLWSVENGECQKTLKGHTNEIFSICFSPDGKWLASGSWDETIKLWSVEDGKLQWTLKGHKKAVTDIDFSPDGKWLVSGSWDNTVKLWSVEDGELQKTQDHTGDSEVFNVEFSSDGKLLASSGSNTIRIWQGINTGEESCLINRLSSTAKALSFKQNEQGTFLATGHEDGTVRYWKLQTIEQKLYLQLMWSSCQNTLLCQDANLEGAKGLSVNNVDLLRQKGALGQPLIIQADHPDWSPLHLAVANNNREQMSQLIQEDYTCLEKVTDDGSTALHIAVCYNLQAVDYLVNQGANRLARDHQGNWPGQLAVVSHQEALAYLPIEEKKYSRKISLHLAAEKGYESLVSWVLQQWKLGKIEIDLNFKKNGRTTAHLTAYHEQTAVHVAAYCGQVGILKLLKEGGADLLVKDKHGETPLHCAVYSGQPKAVEWLLNEGGFIENLHNAELLGWILHLAAKKGCEPIIAWVLQQRTFWKMKVNFNFKNDDNETLACVAAYNGQVEALKLLEKGGANLLVKDSTGGTLLHRAAASNQVKTIEWLLSKEVSIEVLDKYNCTPLHRAAECGAKKVVELLLQKGANPFALNKGKKTPIEWARDQNRTKIAEFIEQFIQAHGVSQKISENNKALDVKQARLLKQKKTTVSSLMTNEEHPDWNLLHLAVANNDKEQMYQLIEEKSIPLENVTADGSTVLHLAVRYNGEAVEFLLDQGVNSLARDKEGNWPGQLALKLGKKKLLAYLSIEDKVHPQQTPLHLAAKNGHERVVVCLIQQWKAGKIELDLNAVNHEGNTPLLLAAEASVEASVNDKKSNDEIIKILLENGANVHSGDGAGNVVAHHAALSGQLEILNLLQDRGVNLLNKDKNLINSDGYTPFYNIVFGFGHYDGCSYGSMGYHLYGPRAKLQSIEWFLKQSMAIEVETKNSNGETVTHLAARYGHVEALKLLKGRGANLFATDNRGNAPFHMAVASGQVVVVKWLLEQRITTEFKNDKGETIVGIAACRGNVEILKLLKEYGADLLAKDNKGNTPLHLAVIENKVEAVEWLLEQEIPIELRNDEGETAVHIAATKSNMTILQLLKERGADLLSKIDGFTPLHVAVFNNQVELTKWFLEQGISVETKDDENTTATHIAAMKGHVRILAVLKEKGANLLTKDNSNFTPFDFAVRGNKVEIVEWFLDQGIPIEFKNEDGETATHIVAQKGNVEILRLLKKRGADLLSKTNNGYTPFHIAVVENKVEAVEWFLQQGISIEVKNDEGETAAHVVARKGQIEILKLLKARGANLLAENNNGFMLLHIAVFNNQVEVVKWLLDQGISMELKNNAGETAAYIAARRGYIQILKLLAERGTNLLAKNNKGYTLLRTAVNYDQSQIIEWLIDEGVPIELKDDEGCTAVHIAAIKGDVKILKLLKARGANLLAKDTTSPGGTPLHRAAASNAVKGVEWLLDEGIFIDVLRDDGSTSLHRAAANGQNEAVELLLQRGANPATLNKDGKTPAQLASENDKKETANYIEQFFSANNSSQKLLENDNAQNKQNISVVKNPQSFLQSEEQKLSNVANSNVLIVEANIVQETPLFGGQGKKEKEEKEPSNQSMVDSLSNPTPLLFSVLGKKSTDTNQPSPDALLNEQKIKVEVKALELEEIGDSELVKAIKEGEQKTNQPDTQLPASSSRTASLLFSESIKGQDEKEMQLEVKEKRKEGCCVIL